MKKKFINATILILIVVVFLILKPTKRFIPLIVPNVNVTYNQHKIKTVKSDYNWFNEENGGNSAMADWPTNLAKKIKAINVQSGDKIEFSFSSFWKQPSETEVRLVASDNSTTKLVENTNFFNAPKEKGEYIYLISGYWDDTHCIGYVIKINVE